MSPLAFPTYGVLVLEIQQLSGDPALQVATPIGLDHVTGRISGLELQVSPASPVDIVPVESLANTMLSSAPS